MKTEIVTRTTMTCPVCGNREEIDIPPNHWLVFYFCASCGMSHQPLPGDCCVICSYGEHHCIPRQLEALANDKGKE